MKRSRAFILAEIVLTIMLQAGFILVLCTSFYLLTSFYAQTQQVLVARDHAERVISFVDDKIRHAGLGLWKCGSPQMIGETLAKIPYLDWGNTRGRYRLPVSISSNDGKMEDTYIPSKTDSQNVGDVLTLLYAQRDLSSGDSNEIITTFAETKTLDPLKSKVTGNYLNEVEGKVPLLDKNSDSLKRLTDKSLFSFRSNAKDKTQDIKRYSVMKGAGVPIYLNDAPASGKNVPSNLTLKAFNVPASMSKDITIPAGDDLMGLVCMQMFVHNRVTGEGGQFAFRELKTDGGGWYKTYNQEKNILDVYMKLDTSSSTFTLWVLATGGYDVNLSSPRPSSWPDSATWTEEYSHHIAYVSRATWKLHNIPPNFTW